MTISPYVFFGGNCEEAILLYEKAFGAKAQIVRYKDAPPESGYPIAPDAENLVMHAQIDLPGAALMFCDSPPESPMAVGDNIAIMVAFDDLESIKSAFAALSVGGKVEMELQETFWSKCYGALKDAFGINWQISLVE